MRTKFLLPLCLLVPGLPAHAVVLASYDFTSGPEDTSGSLLVTADDYDPRSAAVGGDDSATSTGTGTAFMRAENTPDTTNPDGHNFYHSFTLTVDGLGAGQTLDLTSLTYDYFITSPSNGSASLNYFTGIYSPTTGIADLSGKLGGYSFIGLTQTADSDVVNDVVDLTSANGVAGSAFTGLGNGSSVEFRIYFGDTSSSNGRIHRIDNLEVNGTVVPEPGATLLGAFGLTLLLRRRR